MRRVVQRPRRSWAIAQAREIGKHYDVPIDLEQVIADRGIELRYEDLDPHVYGMFLRRGARELIVVDTAKQGVLRRRFTLAHDLGHAVLMKQDGYVLDVFGTRDVLPVPQGDRIGTVADDVEADAFALELLMPEHIVQEMMGAFEATRLPTSEDVQSCAHHFEVSSMTMAIRLNQLGYALNDA